MEMKVSTIAWIAAVVLFVIAALGISFGSINLLALGLAALAGGFVLQAWKM